VTNKRFRLAATVSTDNPGVLGPVLAGFIGRLGSVKEIGRGEYLVKAEIEGTSAKDLNRSLLSALRKAEKRTRLRAEWSSGSTIERYFDYVLKGTTTIR
jgi:hypothetical protein